MSLEKIRAGIITRLETLPGLPPLTVENKTGDEVPADGVYTQFFFDPGQDTAETLGDKGVDRYRGFFQVDYNVPAGTGARAAMLFHAEMKKLFGIGKGTTYQGQDVRFTSCRMSQGRDIGHTYRHSITVDFEADSYRN